MTRRIVLLALFLLFFSVPGTAFSGSNEALLHITGMVRHSMHLGMDDLRMYQNTRVQRTEVMEDKDFRGVFLYRGVPLKYLLTQASIQKPGASFKKPIDLAVVVKDNQGQEVALSWGEVFFRNPGNAIIAFEATAVRPKKDPEHIPESQRPFLQQLDRRVIMPKLVMANDFYSDRCLEGIREIKVVHLPYNLEEEGGGLFSSEVVLKGAVESRMTLKDLDSFQVLNKTVKVAGEGKGYHGLDTVKGISLQKLLVRAEAVQNKKCVVMISAPDGYRSLLSWGEIFLGREGDEILLAELGDPPASKGGKFTLVVPGDLLADRWVSAVKSIEVMSPGDYGK